MPFAPPIAGRRRLRVTLLAVGVFVAGAASGFARDPQPQLRIPLEPFGFQPVPVRYLLQGATMLTLDYLDSNHLLVTFGVSRLMPRLAECPPDDDDHTVEAVLLELPTGRELARTEWRFHDLGQYLWDLGGGRFMLRNRDTLTTLAPLQNLAAGHAFAQEPFLHFERQIHSIEVSANHDLLSIETVKREPPKPVDPNLSQGPPPPVARHTGLLRRDPSALSPGTGAGAAEGVSDSTPFQIDFIRLVRPGASPGQALERARIVPVSDGRIHTSKSVTIPLTTEGFLRSRAATRDGVLLDFLTFEGKDLDLGDFATSCPPRPTFVSPSEFIAFGCRGSDGALDLAGFNLHGDFLWQMNFTDEQAYPSIASAVAAGRFAFSRTVTSTHVFGTETPSVDQLEAQEVRVIQMYNGKQLLRVTTSPIQRAGQNYTLSPDGLSLAVIHDTLSPVKGGGIAHSTAIEIYPLPSLSDKDQAQVRIEAAMAPPAKSIHMRFSLDEIKSQGAVQTGGKGAVATLPASDPAPTCDTMMDTATGATAACPAKAKTEPAKPTTDAAETTPDHPRKPPTLYEPAPASPPQ
jgi:hypothetical protein